MDMIQRASISGAQKTFESGRVGTSVQMGVQSIGGASDNIPASQGKHRLGKSLKSEINKEDPSSKS